MSEATASENGFEYAGTFYPWHVTTTGKDLLLIDRISGMAPQEFFDLIDDSYDLSRSPVLLALIATSMRARHPERSIERIVRTVMDLDLEEIEIVGGDDEEDGEQLPPASAGAEPAPNLSVLSSPESNGSQATPSETLSATPA